MGLDLALRTSLSETSLSFPWGTSEHLITIRLVLTNNQAVTVVSAYAPTLDSDGKKKRPSMPAYKSCLKSPGRTRSSSWETSMLGLAGINISGKAMLAKTAWGNINSNGVLPLTKCT